MTDEDRADELYIRRLTVDEALLKLDKYLNAAFVAGLIVAFWPYALSHHNHPNLILIAWIPLALLYLRRFIKRGKKRDALFAALHEDMTNILAPASAPLEIDANARPYVILMVGINGAGKTTTIGKLAKKFQLEGRSVMLAAGDTFRAAAVEQLQEWGKRNEVTVVAQHAGADTASVIFDAVQSAKSKGVDVLIADTAGRLHTQSNLMEELKKVRRVITRLDETAPHEVMLVLDAGIGQNAVVQAEQFRDAVGVSGITLTKLDGTAKGGVIFAVAKRLGLPIRFIGVGEGIDDLRPFEPKEFVDALLARNDE